MAAPKPVRRYSLLFAALSGLLLGLAIAAVASVEPNAFLERKGGRTLSQSKVTITRDDNGGLFSNFKKGGLGGWVKSFTYTTEPPAPPPPPPKPPASPPAAKPPAPPPAAAAATASPPAAKPPAPPPAAAAAPAAKATASGGGGGNIFSIKSESDGKFGKSGTITASTDSLVDGFSKAITSPLKGLSKTVSLSVEPPAPPPPPPKPPASPPAPKPPAPPPAAAGGGGNGVVINIVKGD